MGLLPAICSTRIFSSSALSFSLASPFKSLAISPALTKALGTAYENLRNEEEEQMARGGKQILSSMDADEDNY